MTDNPLSSEDPQAQLKPPTAPTAASPIPQAPEVVPQPPHSDTPVSLPPTEPAMDEAAKQEFLWHTHEYLGEFARFADTKAAFAGAIAAALLGALYSAKAHVPLQEPFRHWAFFTWLAALGALFLFASIVLALWTVWPRLRSTQTKGFIYWGSIAQHRTIEHLQTSFHSQSARTLNDHLLHHVFDISSKVCIPKYRHVSLCILALSLGGLLASAALILQDAPEKTPPTARTPLSPPPCKNGAASCEPWERDWSKIDLKSGTIVTKEGTIVQPH